MTTVILGANGLLGSAVARAIPGLRPPKYELNIHNEYSLASYFKEHKPDLVINCAAVSNVDKSETEGWQATLTNALGPELLAWECKKIKATLIHISTDYVFPDWELFDLDLPIGWREVDHPEPSCTYGKIKLAGEAFAQINPKTYIIRVSSLYGSDRSCHTEWITKALETKKEVKICDDMIGSPTYTEDLAKWIKDLLEVKPAYGIYHATPNGHVSRYDFAIELLKGLGVKLPFKPLKRIKIKDLYLPSNRPAKPLLDNDKWQSTIKKLPTWQDSLKRYTMKLRKVYA